MKPAGTLPDAYEIRKLAARLRSAGGKRIEITPDTAYLLDRVLCFYADVICQPHIEGGFVVDLWHEGAIVETLARSPNGIVARAAYEAALVARPGSHITLRHGARVMTTTAREET